MKRNPEQLARQTYDLLIVGGGIYGACLAWDASLRGLSVALVEKGDFASATSANSLKMIHGGLRYLQHADFVRMRESIHERRTLMRIAPHLVHPLPVVVPTYGHGVKGREAMTIALLLNDWISLDRNWNLSDPQKHIPDGQVIGVQDCLHYLPGISSSGLTGGAIFYDAQVYNSERLVVSLLHSAVAAGADVANYLEVTGFLQQENCITGVRVVDYKTGEAFEIQSNFVVNTVGPWTNQLLGQLPQNAKSKVAGFAKAMNFVTRPLFKDYAVGISSTTAYNDKDALLKKGSRLLFIAPWRDRSLVGTWYAPFEGNPNEFCITEDDIQSFLKEVNQAYPPAKLSRNDIDFVHGGLLPSTDVSQSDDVQLAKHYTLYDHRQDGIKGLLTVTGVKYTTARDVAEKTVDWIGRATGRVLPKSTSSETPIWGGEIQNFTTFLKDVAQQHPEIEDVDIRRLGFNYGSAYGTVLQYSTHLSKPIYSSLDILRAEVIHAVREEMASTLSDVIFRRTEWGSAGSPGSDILYFCVDVMADELGWNSETCHQEVQKIEKIFAWMCPTLSDRVQTCR